MSQHEEKMNHSRKGLNDQGYMITLLVDQPPKEVFNAINNVREWWAGIWDGKIVGRTTNLNDEFIYSVLDVHYSKQKIIDFIPNKKVKWYVLDAKLSFTKTPDEWKGTKISFEIHNKSGKTELTFTHLGLLSTFECYDNCSNAWNILINTRLKNLIMSRINK